MSDAEDDFELVTNARMLAPAPALRREPVTLNDWKTQSGKKARFLVWELTASDFNKCIEEGWSYKNGVRVKYDEENNDVRFLAHVIRDPHGNRLWNTIEGADGAKAQLGLLGRGTIRQLVEAGNKMNAPKEAAKEGNSETTETDS